jgi:hypothetical protein
VRTSVAHKRLLWVQMPKPSRKWLHRHKRRRSHLWRTARLRVTIRQQGNPPPNSFAPGSLCPQTFGSFGVGAWPLGCWRPYGDGSPFNKPIPAQPRVLANSAQIVSRFLGWDQISDLTAGTADTGDDWSHPTYYSQPGDPVYRIHCDVYACPQVEGLTIHVPDQARPAGGGDGHMTVVDQGGHWEYDFWQVKDKPAGGGTLTASSGGRTAIGTPESDGLGSDGNAAQWGLLAGIIRAPEMAAGQINHALFMVTRCDDGSHVYPAQGDGRPCSALGESDADAPPMGARLQLDLSDPEIDALPVPAWKKTILRAMAHYGLYLGDTGGGFLQFESGSTYTSFGYQDQMVSFAQAHLAEGGITASGGTYNFDIKDGVPWNRLRVLDPCVTQGTC